VGRAGAPVRGGGIVELAGDFARYAENQGTGRERFALADQSIGTNHRLRTDR
jgi:hypothetical protein